MWREKICHNDFEKKQIEDRVIDGFREIISSLDNSKNPFPAIKDDVLRSAIKKSGISSLIEFSRAIHAEMAAILAVARDKRHSIRGASMFVTTYPCHNCARHIVAAGIREVIYIEPYTKSLATKLHPDSISEDERDKNKVHFKQYQGFAPKHILDLFRPREDRKRDGKIIDKTMSSLMPVYRRHLDSFTIYEDIIVLKLNALRSQPAKLFDE